MGKRVTHEDVDAYGWNTAGEVTDGSYRPALMVLAEQLNLIGHLLVDIRDGDPGPAAPPELEQPEIENQARDLRELQELESQVRDLRELQKAWYRDRSHLAHVLRCLLEDFDDGAWIRADDDRHLRPMPPTVRVGQIRTWVEGLGPVADGARTDDPEILAPVVAAAHALVKKWRTTRGSFTDEEFELVDQVGAYEQRTGSMG